MVDFYRKDRLTGETRRLSEEEKAREDDQNAKAFSGILVAGLLGWAVYATFGGLDTPSSKAALIAAVISGLVLGVRFATYLMGLIGIGFLLSLGAAVVWWVSR